MLLSSPQGPGQPQEGEVFVPDNVNVSRAHIEKS